MAYNGAGGRSDADDLIDTLTSAQKDLLIGLGHGSPGTIAMLTARIPGGTKELLVAHDALTPEGSLTPLGEYVADCLAFMAGEGPDPQLLVSARSDEAGLLSSEPDPRADAYARSGEAKLLRA